MYSKCYPIFSAYYNPPTNAGEEKNIAHSLNESSCRGYWLVASEQLVHIDSLDKIPFLMFQSKNVMDLATSLKSQALFCCPTKVDYILIVHDKRETFWTNPAMSREAFTSQTLSKTKTKTRKCSEMIKRWRTRQMG